MYNLPTSITIENKEHAIQNNGDFRMVLDCFLALNDEELDEKYRVLTALTIFYAEIHNIEDIKAVFNNNIENAINKMYEFFNCNQVNSGLTTSYKLIDWEQDAQMICSAVNNVTQKEIRSEPYIHWWTFMGYYCSVGESVLSTVVGIRNKIVKGKKLEKYEKEFKQANPNFFNWKAKTAQQQDADNLIKEIWNKN